MTVSIVGQPPGELPARPAPRPRFGPSRLRRLSRLAGHYLLHPPLPLRWRIALLYTAVLGLTLLAADVTIYIALAHYLDVEIDNNLRDQARELSGTIDIVSARINPAILLPNLDAFASPGMTVQVLTLDGQVRTRSENLRNRDVPLHEHLVMEAVKGASSFVTEEIDGTPVRIYYAPLEPRLLPGNIAGAIQITRSLRDMEITLIWLRLLLIGIGGASLFFATAAGYVLASWFPHRKIGWAKTTTHPDG